jgi:hypothetical protein
MAISSFSRSSLSTFSLPSSKAQLSYKKGRTFQVLGLRTLLHEKIVSTLNVFRWALNPFPFVRKWHSLIPVSSVLVVGNFQAPPSIPRCKVYSLVTSCAYYQGWVECLIYQHHCGQASPLCVLSEPMTAQCTYLLCFKIIIYIRTSRFNIRPDIRR